MVFLSINFLFILIFIILTFYFKQIHQLPLSYSTYHSTFQSFNSKSGHILDFLVKFGYVPEDDYHAGSIRSSDYLKDAIRRMQRFGGLPDTGVIDEATYNLTKRPRCGVPDYFPSDPHNRVKRYVTNGKWNKLSLTWRFNGSALPTMDRDTMLREFYQGFELWSRYSKLTFHRSEDVNADIIITFFSGDHGDGRVFDGLGNTLAHAYFPGPSLGGDVHFDADERWRRSGLNDRNSTSLFSVAAHEFGHSIGLAHSQVSEALMFPYYGEIDYTYELPRDDINGVQELYGTRPGSDPPKPPANRPTFTTVSPNRPTTSIPKSPDVPTTCDTDFDAIATIRGEVFFFKDRYFWRLSEDKRLATEYAFPISSFWFNLPTDFAKIDAVYERPFDSKITFFIGDKYWLFNGNTAEPGYPRSIYSLGLPRELKSIDAVTTWGYNNLVYIFAGDQYWRFDERKNKVELDYPRAMKIWKGVPTHLDAALHWQRNGKTYFFKGRGFWQFDDRIMSVTSDSPQSSVHFWFDQLCRDADYPDLSSQGATEPSIRASTTTPLLITFSYFTCLFFMLIILFIFNTHFLIMS